MKQTTLFYFSLLCVTIISIIGCKKGLNELEQNGLNGNIKSIREISYQAYGNQDTIVKGEVVMGNDMNNYFAQYNTDGNQTSITNYDNLGEQIDKWIFRYSVKGEALGGNYYYKDNTLLDSTYYIKDSDGNILEYYHLFADGRLKYKVTYKYNCKGKVLEEKVFDHENLLHNTVKYTYKHGNPICDENYDRNNNLEYFSRYTYDNKDRLIAQQIYNNDSTVNTSGTYAYNEHDDIIRQTTKVPSEKDIIYTYTYKYDKNKNWIQRITFINNSVAYITLRQIEYYD
ncbi:MAG: hypothetical protein ACTTJH_04575 [Bacteroidales bacterium]